MKGLAKGLALVVGIALIVALGAGGWYFLGFGKAAPPTYRTVEVVRTDVASAISATGALVPEETVDVGAQVNGKISTFGTDAAGRPVDFRSELKRGMVLAKIDDSLYVADLSAAKAQLAQATAQKNVAKANLDQAKAKLIQAGLDLTRSKNLKGNIPQADIDAAQSTYDQSTAAVAVQEATIGQASAQEEIAKSQILRAQQNLDYCTISSPVDGVIIDKKVDVGQTVVASLNAPSLFLIAKDLRKMLVLVQVNEADIGSVRDVKEATFTVDAVPGRTFKGVVRKVRLNASMSQNVVTYTVEVAAENPDLKLYPYMTANVRFVTASRDDVLAVPNAALRFTPSDAAPATAGERPGGGGTTSRPTSRRSGGGGGGDHRATHGTVWTVGPDGRAVAIPVRVGITDGTVTEISGEGLSEGMQVIVGQTGGAAASDQTTNPFAPRFGGRRR